MPPIVYLVVGIIGIVRLVSVGNGKHKKDDNTPFVDRKFDGFYKILPVISTPQQINCNYEDIYALSGFGSQADKNKYSPRDRNVDVIGKLFETEKSVFILYSIYDTVRTPWLYTYTKDGRIIDSLCLFNRPCNFDSSKVYLNTCSFKANHIIEQTDSLIKLKFDTLSGNWNRISCRYMTRIYELENSGKRYKLKATDGDIITYE